MGSLKVSTLKDQWSNRCEAVFEQIIEEHGSALFHYIFSLVKHKELAEDLYQEMLISAFIALPNFEERANYKTWLYKIATNKCRDYWRKEKMEQKFWNEKLHLYECSSEWSSMPEDCLCTKYTEQEILEMIHTLPEMYREPIMLYYYEHCSLKEISNVSRLPISTVKTRMRRAKDKLRIKLGANMSQSG